MALSDVPESADCMTVRSHSIAYTSVVLAMQLLVAFSRTIYKMKAVYPCMAALVFGVCMLHIIYFDPRQHCIVLCRLFSVIR